MVHWRYDHGRANARNAGVRSILVRTGHGGRDGKHGVEPDFTFDTLLEAVRFVIAEEKSVARGA
jgi:phosphoglycolate phosphatase-like HAD superfamily hydrolase